MNINLDSANKERIRALIVDDQVSISGLWGMMLGREERFVAPTRAATGREGLLRFRSHPPELVIAALSLPELSGPEMIRAMRKENRAARILIYTGTRNPDLLRAGLDAQPDGFVHKTEDLEILRQAIFIVTQGARFFSPYASRFDEKGENSGEAGGRLTSKERTVLRLVAEGMSSKQAAERLSLSTKTVDHYRLKLMQKLALHDVASLTRYAVRCGLVSID